jgi:ribonuclease-3
MDKDDINLSIPHITREQIQEILGDVRPRCLDNYQRALVHKSLNKHIKYTLEQGLPVCSYFVEEKQPADNERLELLGDAVLDYIVTKYLFTKYPKHDEGFITRLKIKIVKGTHCVKFSKIIGLGKYILAGSIVKKDADGNYNDKLLEDAFEAFLGAIELDLGIKFSNNFVVKLIEDHVDLNSLLYDDNYKDILMRYTQSKKIDLPIYNVIGQDGPPHKKIFTVQISIRIDKEMKMGIGSGSTKKDAEQLAAKNTLGMIDPADLGNIPGRDTGGTWYG